jgi:RNAse (barnase) inhibitor barstar
MPIDSSNFTFGGEVLPLDSVGVLVAHVPSGLGTKGALMSALTDALKLPQDWGRNWDALSDCLGDFWWTHARRIVLVHEDVPPLPPRDLDTYLEVLDQALRDWQRDEGRRLIVVFPESGRNLLSTT